MSLIKPKTNDKRKLFKVKMTTNKKRPYNTSRQTTNKQVETQGKSSQDGAS